MARPGPPPAQPTVRELVAARVLHHQGVLQPGVVRKVADELGISTQRVYQHLTRLREWGQQAARQRRVS